MKILHLLSQRPECTGSGIYLQNVIEQAGRAGHSNMLLAGVPEDTTPVLTCLDGHASCYLTFSGGDLPFPVAGMSDVMPYKSCRFIDLDAEEIAQYQQAFAIKISEAVKLFHPDIIHSHHLWLMTGTARMLLPHIPLVTTCHSTDLRQYHNCAHLRDNVTEPCRNIDRVMALSKDQAAQITALYGIDTRRIRVVGGGFNETLFVGKEKHDVPPCEIVYAGKLSRAKGVPWLLRSMEKLAHLPLRLHLVGSGSGMEEEECRMLAAQLGERVVLHGRLSQPELAVILGKSHLFVLPSFYEGLPLALLEALACGCRIVATDLPGCREIFPDSKSELVELISLPPLDGIDEPFAKDWPQLENMLAGAIALQVKRIMDDPLPAQEEVAALTGAYTWEQVFARIEGVYAEAVESRGLR